MPKAHTNEPDSRIEDMRARCLEHVSELWETHIAKALTILEESESKKVNFTFRVELDFSESKAIEEVTLAFSQVFKDKRTSSFDDPDAPALPGLDGEEEGNTTRRTRNGKKEEAP